MLKWTKQPQLQQQQQQLSYKTPNQPSKSQRPQQKHEQQQPPYFIPLATISNTQHSQHRKRNSTGQFHKSSKNMPTMTHILERRMHRHSLDNQLDSSARHARHSLTHVSNKENFGVYFTPSPYGSNNSLNAFQDLSNGKSPRRSERPAAAANRRQTLSAMPLHIKRDRNSPSPLRRFSNDFGSSANDSTPLSRLRFASARREESPTSSRMGDVTLDRMLDAIIESARKEIKCPCTQAEARSVTPVEAVNSLYELETSIHEMEVRTPTHLKRQRVVRRKNGQKGNTEQRHKAEEREVKTCERTTPPRRIGLTLPNGIPSPDTPLFKHQGAEHEAQLLAMKTPPNLVFVVDSDYQLAEADMQRCSTPTLEEAQSIKRCLSFSSADEDDADFSSAAKRSSVASSNTSSMGEYYLSGRTSRSSQNSMKMWHGRGSVELTVRVEQRQLNVHVIRCRDLQRPNGSTALNAYVKVALIRHKTMEENYFQRTAVHRHSSRPYFDHHFRFHLGSERDVENAEVERLQLAVWHRDRQLKRSEFLGCMSFPLHTLLQQPINGTYKLQSQTCLTNPQPPIQLQTHTVTAALHTQPAPPPPPLPPHQPLTMTSTLTRQKSDEDVISIDSMAQAAGGGLDQPMVLSKKALHQRDADENLFLRFLELDPPDLGAPAPSSSSSTGAGNNNNSTANAAGSGGRRLSASGKPIGRTPFTMTKKLTRTAERGFGFSIVWTHPPRVEKIEPGLSADRAGILPGDYVIFVDKQNVVTMPEADVLNLIRSQGSTLTLEIFRRSGSGQGGAVPPALSLTGRSQATTLVMNGKATASAVLATTATRLVGMATSEEFSSVTGVRRASAGVQSSTGGVVVNAAVPNVRPSTACSGGTSSSMEAAKRRLNLPQVTFSKESIMPITDNRRRLILQLISREQNFISALHFGMQRFVQPLLERKDLISPNDHRTLFQNIDELLRISEDILEQLCNDDQEPQLNFASRVYLSKTTAICAAYKKYCNGIKRADCVLVNKSRQTGSEFVAFITEPQVPRKRPDLTMFIHRPLQHFREILKLMQLLASNCHVDTEEHKNFTSVIAELQAAYREITVSSGLMEPLGEGRPLLTLQDLESRMVFTKCKPFTLAVQGRQWIFGGDLSRVEGRSVKPYWTLLFSDIIVFAKVSRDRVLFITEEPIPIANVVDSCFHMRKKTTEFRLTVDPNGRMAESPTGYCAPDLTRTPKKGARRKSLVLRAPSLELKAVWQNLLQRQIFLVNAALGSTPLSSPLDSPDVLNTLVPLSDIGIASASIGSIKVPSMDSINLKNSQQQCKRFSNASDQIEMLIDEKCRILNKTGTSKSNALHLANWMKGQLDKQQEQARLAAQRSRENISQEDEHLLYPESDQDERITYWTRQQLERRTKELNLTKENGNLKARPNFGGKRLSGVEELSMSDAYSENVSQLSQSHSTTSDSQITVRSSPIVLDKLAVCRHCHKNCQQSGNAAHQQQQKMGATTTDAAAAAAAAANNNDSSGGALVCNSLKVQHSQSSPNRCCRLNGSTSRTGSVSSMSSSTITGEQPSEHSSKVVASSSRRETGDTESDVAQLITDDLSQSEATDDSIGGIPSSSSGVDEARRRLTDNFNKIRILDQSKRVIQESDSERKKEPTSEQVLTNGYCSSTSEDRPKPTPPPRNLRVTLRNATTSETTQTGADQQVKTTVTITETAKIVRMQEPLETHSKPATTPTKSPRTPRTPVTPKSPAGSSPRATQFIACNCECTPADFENTTLSPDELEQQTCKLIESPKQSPKMARAISKTSPTVEDPHKHCKCVCGTKARNQAEAADDDDLSLMLIGLAQLTPAAKLLHMRTPTAPMPTPSEPKTGDANFVPEIAVVPPTPEAVLTMTTTNVWDNSGVSVTTSMATQLHINNVPRQAVIENIPEDSCDESPLDEEPPYRPMSNTLRRYGTMSSLEKLPSDERVEDGELDDDDEDEVEADDADDDDDDADDDDLDDKARADAVERIVAKGVEAAQASGVEGAWSSRAGSFVSGKMSFFEESRAFIDKYLGRWNQEQGTPSAAVGAGAGAGPATSETDEQLDECTSGATSGEEVWGTPTSGGENDDGHLVNSENTYSSPTKSSNSLNDDDDTELMMDELLMAPPMTASTIRGLLPRRRLEPLFEEETESDEEKTQQESEEVKKGETTTNGHYLEDSAGSSSDEDLANERGEEEEYDEEEDEEEEEPTSTEERLQPDLQTNSLGPRPLRYPGIIPATPTPTPTPTPTTPTPAAAPAAVGIPLPAAVLRASSCEYLLEQRSAVALRTTNSCSSSSPAVTATSSTSTSRSMATVPSETHTLTMTATMRSTTTMTMTATRTLPKSPAASSTSTTINSASDTIKSSNTNSSSSSNTVAGCGSISPAKAAVRPAKFIPPPPPPRRLLLTQTNLKTGGGEAGKVPPPRRKSGASADVGSSVDAGVDADIHTTATPIAKPATSAATARSSSRAPASAVAGIGSGIKRPSSTIIETSLLGSVADKRPASTSLPTALTTSEKREKQLQQQQETAQPAQKPPPRCSTETTAKPGSEGDSTSAGVPPPGGSGLSPRLEMRLALNHDILGDEDLICYDPGPDLTTILGHDLSTFQRLTGRDLLNRSATNRVQPREAVISFSQQRNSKMDTPTVNRRPRPTGAIVSNNTNTSSNPASLVALAGGARVGGAPQHLQPNRNTWSNFAYADRIGGDSVRSDDNSKNYSYSSDESKLSDLEILARREKTYCMSQLKSGSQAKTTMTKTRKQIATTTTTTTTTRSRDSSISPQLTRTRSTISMGGETESHGSHGGGNMRVRKIGRDETALMEAGKGNRLINFIKRRNSEVPISPNCSQSSLSESNTSGTPVHRQTVQMSPRKDNDKPSLNRRLWKQITKRRRANSVSEVVAS